MRTRPLVLLCWAQVAIAALLVLLNFHSLIHRPTTGMTLGRDGEVLGVSPEGPAERAGIHVGDRVVSLNAQRVSPEIFALYFVRAGESIPLTLERNAALIPMRLTTMSAEELREANLVAGGGRTMSALSEYLNFPLHIWMIGIAVALLVLRPDNKSALLSALSLVFWAGSMFLFRSSGVGAVLEGLPDAVALPLYFFDAFFSAAFFAVCCHFALVFPTEQTPRRPRLWELAPYLVATPIFIEVLTSDLLRQRHLVTSPHLPWTDAYATFGTLLLVASLVTLAVRASRMRDANARRRMKLILVALLPGTAAFAFGYAVELFNLGYTWSMTAHFLHPVTTMFGSGIYAYAVVRHRMYNVRILVRRSIQYALAKGTLFVLMSLPIIGLAAFLFTHRDESIDALLTGTPAVYVLLLLPLFLVIRYRRRLLDSLDRRFFREQYDARRLLLQVVSIIRGGSDMLTLSQAALDEIDRALHPKYISLWQLDADGSELRRSFVRGEGAPADAPALSVEGTIATLLAADDEPLDVHSRPTRALLQRLPQQERGWLEAADAYLIVPLLIEKRLVGLMVLGERKSEEPYGREDRELLRLLGAQLALTLDYSRLKHSPSLVWAPSAATSPVHFSYSDIVHLCPRCGRCYAASESRCDADDQTLVPETGVPRVIEDKYIVTRLLGRGGMGSVYLATQKRLNRPVAIKVLLAHLVGSSSMRTRFEREARIVARLRHPAIVTIHDFGVLPTGHAYLVMEYLDGETLRKMIVDGAQPLASALEIITPVGEAIDTAHRAGVVHRDLKPENIMMAREHDRAPAPRVLDFGLAKMNSPIGEDEATLMQSGHSAGIVGTLMYMAPEVLSGHVADARADQYSLGLIAYELLAGEHPLCGANDLASVVRGHTEVSVPPLRARVDVPEHVGNAIHRALAKRAEERFASVGDFVRAMNA